MSFFNSLPDTLVFVFSCSILNWNVWLLSSIPSTTLTRKQMDITFFFKCIQQARAKKKKRGGVTWDSGLADLYKARMEAVTWMADYLNLIHFSDRGKGMEQAFHWKKDEERCYSLGVEQLVIDRSAAFGCVGALALKRWDGNTEQDRQSVVAEVLCSSTDDTCHPYVLHHLLQWRRVVWDPKRNDPAGDGGKLTEIACKFIYTLFLLDIGIFKHQEEFWDLQADINRKELSHSKIYSALTIWR